MTWEEFCARPGYCRQTWAQGEMASEMSDKLQFVAGFCHSPTAESPDKLKFVGHYGRPDSAPKNRYLDWLYHKLTSESPCRTLEDTLCAAVARAFQIVDGKAAPVEAKPKEIIR